MAQVTIDKARYDELMDSELLCTALEQAGVDNWEGYSEAMKLYLEWKKD